MLRLGGKWGRSARMARSAYRLAAAGLMLLLLMLMCRPGEAFAHSVLLEASPPPNSTLASPPERIRLAFNERLENGLYSIYVFDDKGAKIVMPPAVMSLDQREVSVQLPKLADGLYTVSYHIISADGHPVDASYLMTVGKPTGQTGAAGLGHKHLETVFGFRMLQYLFFLMLVGWVVWKPYVPLADEEAARRYRKWLNYWRHLNLLFMVETIALQTIDAAGDITWRNVTGIWLHTAVGWSWIALIAISLAAYLLLGRLRVLDLAWAAGALLAKTLSGHPLAAVPVWKAAVPDLFHLAAGALWAGGLGIAAVLARHHPAELRAFLPRLSKAALYSLIVLAVTGSVLTLTYVSKLTDLLYAGWGRWLLVKIALVALVVVTGARLRRLMRHGKVGAEGAGGAEVAGATGDAEVTGAAEVAESAESAGAAEAAEAAGATEEAIAGATQEAAAGVGSENGESNGAGRLNRWLQFDLVLMGAIVAVVGIFTYLSPTPANAPLEWKVEEPGILRTVSITPNTPGAAANQFAVYITQQNELPPVKLVQLKLVPVGREDVAPIEVPLQRRETASGDRAAKSSLAAFMAEGPYLPFPGKWKVELTVRDANDDERVWSRDMRVF